MHRLHGLRPDLQNRLHKEIEFLWQFLYYRNMPVTILLIAIGFILGCTDKNSHLTKTDANDPFAESVFMDPRDSSEYKIIKIGSQLWMTENLNYDANGSVCYKNDSGNCAKYGRLYNWSAASTACPPGWHLPSSADWDKLLRYVDDSDDTSEPYDSPVAGKHLKAVKGWDDCSACANTYGFSALPGGYCYGNLCGGIGNTGRWWSNASDENGILAYSRGLTHDKESANWFYNDKLSMYSVRCIQD